MDDDQHTIKQAERGLLLILSQLIHVFAKWKAVENLFVYHLQMVIRRYRMNSSGLMITLSTSLFPKKLK